MTMHGNGPWRPSQSTLPTPPSSGPPRRLASVPPSSTAAGPSSVPQKHVYRHPYDVHAYHAAQYAKNDALTLPPIEQLERAAALPVHKPWASHSPLTPPDDAPLPHQHLPPPLPTSSCASSSSSLSAFPSTYTFGTASASSSAASLDIPYMSSLAPPTRQHPFASSSSSSSSSFYNRYASQQATLPSNSSTGPSSSAYQSQSQSNPRLHSETHSPAQAHRQQQEQHQHQPRSAVVASEYGYRRASWAPSGSGPHSAYAQESYGQSNSSPVYAWNTGPSMSNDYQHQIQQQHLASPSLSPVDVKVEAEIDEDMGVGPAENEEADDEDGEEVYGGRYGVVQAHIPSDDDIEIEVEEVDDGDKENVCVEADPYIYFPPQAQAGDELAPLSASEDGAEDEKRMEEEKLTEWVTTGSPRRSNHFLAEKMCEMVCYLWFSASLGPDARRRRRERERERAREERDSPRRGRTRELGTQSSAHHGSSSRPSSSAHAQGTRTRSSHHPNPHTKSQSQAPPYPLTTPTTASLQFSASPEFVAFMHRLLATTQVSRSVIVLALHYIYRLKEGNEFSVGRAGSEFRVGVVALMLANKFVDDNTYTNKTWSDVSAISLTELNKMEREFLLGVNYSLFVDKATFESWLNLLRGLVCAKEREFRRWRGDVGRSLNLGLGLSGVTPDGRQVKPLKVHAYGYGLGDREERARSSSPPRQRTGGARPSGYGYAYAPAYPFTFSVAAPTAQQQQQESDMLVDGQHHANGNAQIETSPMKHKRTASDAFSPPPPSLLQPNVKVRRPTGLVLDIGAAIAAQQCQPQSFHHSAHAAYSQHPSQQQTHSRPGTGFADSLHRLEKMSLATPVDGSGVVRSHSQDRAHVNAQGHVLGAPYDPQSAARRAGPAPERLYFYALAGSPGAQGGVDPEGDAAGLGVVDEAERARMEERGRKVKAWLRCVEAPPANDVQRAPTHEMAYPHYPSQQQYAHGRAQQTSNAAQVYARPTQDPLPGIAALELPASFTNPTQAAYASQPTSVAPPHSHTHYAPPASHPHASEAPVASLYPPHQQSQPHVPPPAPRYNSYAYGAPSITIPISGVPPMASLPLGTQSARTSPYHAPVPVPVSAYMHAPAGSTSYAQHALPSHLHQHVAAQRQVSPAKGNNGHGQGWESYTAAAYPSVPTQGSLQAQSQPQPSQQQTQTQMQTGRPTQGRTRSSSVFANAGPPGVYPVPAAHAHAHAGSAAPVGGYVFAAHPHAHAQTHPQQNGYAFATRTGQMSELSGALGYR